MIASIATAKRGGAALLIGAALVLGATACGDDEETDSVSTPTAPAQTSEESATGEATTEEETPTDDSGGVGPGEGTETEEGENEGPDDSGGGVGPSGGGHDPGQPDSADNDVPPEPGSPQEAFEQYCDENPEACG